MEIRNEELNNSKRGRSKAGDEGSSEESESSGLPATALPPSEEILEKNLFDAIFWRKQSLVSNDMVCLVFIMMLNSRQQEIVERTKYLPSTERQLSSNISGFLDLQSRLSDVASMLELGPNWLEPNKFDLTFTNVKTQKCIINNTEVSTSTLQGIIKYN